MKSRILLFFLACIISGLLYSQTFFFETLISGLSISSNNEDAIAKTTNAATDSDPAKAASKSRNAFSQLNNDNAGFDAPPVPWTKVEDTDPGWTWNGFASDACATCSGGNAFSTEPVGSTAEYDFIGTDLEAFAETWHGAGSMEIFIDGVSKGIFSQDVSPWTGASLFASITGLSGGSHHLKMVSARNEFSYSNWVGIDFIRFGTAIPGSVLGVTLDSSVINLQIPATGQLTATVTPVDAIDKSLTWTSSDPLIASVSASGLVTPVAPGVAIITVTSNDDNSKLTTCQVNVSAPDPWTKADNIDPAWSWTGFNLDNCGACFGGSAHYAGATGSTAQYTFTGTDVQAFCEKFAGAGSIEILIDGVSKGVYAQDTVNYGGGEMFASFKGLTEAAHTIKFITTSANFTGIDFIRYKITLPVPVSGVVVSPATSSIDIAAEKQLTATVTPYDAFNTNINWSSSDAAIATVDANGLIAGIAKGTATITATTVDGGKTATHTVTVGPWIRKDDKSAGWTWVGFAEDGCATCYGGTAYSTDAIGSSAETSFTGTDVEVYCETWDGAGSVEIFIDGVSKGVFSQIVAPYAGATKFAGITGLTDGLHTIKMVTTLAQWTGIDFIRYKSTPFGGVTGITVDAATATIKMSETLQLTATVTPVDAINKTVAWSTSDAAIATVDASGLITAVAVGTATITATTADGGFTATTAVTVTPADSWVIADDKDPNWIWTNYSLDDCASCLGGTTHAINVLGSTAEFTFKGTTVEAYAETWNGAGSVEIFIDGVSKGVFTQSVAPFGGKGKFATIAGLSNSLHKIKFVSTIAEWTSIDYIRFTQDPWTVADDQDPNWIWTNYSLDDCASCLGGTTHAINVLGSTAEYTFTGTNVEAYAETWSGAGSVEIFIDGVSKGIFSLIVPPYGGQGKFASIAGLSNASHVIKFVSTTAEWTSIDFIRFATYPWTVADDQDPNWIWTNYSLDDCASCLSGTTHATNILGSTAEYTFIGTDVEAYAETWNGAGSVEIFIDGVSKGIFSHSVAPFGGQGRFASFTGLTSASHVIKFVSTIAEWTSIDFIAYKNSGNVALPLQLVSFAANFSNNKTNLIWKTENELNVKQFEIERSTDGIRFSQIDVVSSKGGGSYNTVDLQPIKGNNYYRLKMVDKDGKFTYSIILLVKVANKGAFGFTMYPNPGKDFVIIAPTETAFPVNVLIFDQQGRKVLAKQIVGTSSISIGHLAKGIYMVQLINNGSVKVGKLIKE